MKTFNTAVYRAFCQHSVSKHMLSGILFIIILFVTEKSIGQVMNDTKKNTHELSIPSNADRYGKDYEIKDFILTSENAYVLQMIDLNAYEALREESVDVEIYDEAINETIILYAVNRIQKARKTTINSEL